MFVEQNRIDVKQVVTSLSFFLSHVLLTEKRIDPEVNLDTTKEKILLERIG